MDYTRSMNSTLVELAQHIRLLYAKEVPEKAFDQSMALLKMFQEEDRRRFGHTLIKRMREYQDATIQQLKSEVEYATTKKS